MYLILDTETTGLPLFNEPPDHPAQARICQLAYILLDDKFEERACFCSYIKPDNWEVTSGASAATGITTEMCDKFGIPIGAALEVLEKAYEQSEQSIAHNLKFDSFLIDTEMVLYGKYNPFVWSTKGFCTMLKSTEVCKIPKAKGAGFKWPKLIEAHQHLCGVGFDGAHDALADTRACARVFRKLIGK